MEQAKIFLEQAKIFFEEALVFVFEIMAFGGQGLVLAAAAILFILGLVVFYKKGPWLGIPICLTGAFIIIMAILGELRFF